MKIEVKEIKDGILRVTTEDERWYGIPNAEGKTEYVPSVTWISGHYPKGIAFYKWLADKGWNEAEALKTAAGDKGSKVHKAIEDLLPEIDSKGTKPGKTIAHNAKYINNSSGQEEELSVQEYDAIISFASWFNEVKPEVLLKEVTVISTLHDYAGTADLICKIGDETWLIDFKTSANIWPEFELQLSAYKTALQEMGVKIDKMAILQVGYTRNKNGYKFTEVEDKFPLFLAAQQIWRNETEGQTVLQKDYPLEISLNN